MATEDYAKKDEMIGVRISGSVKNQLERIMVKEDRTMSYVANALLRRGLSIYERDGVLREPEQPMKVARVPMEGEITDELQRSRTPTKTPTGKRTKIKAVK